MVYIEAKRGNKQNMFSFLHTLTFYFSVNVCDTYIYFITEGV